MHWNKKSGKWQAWIYLDGKQQSLGYFVDELQAASAYTAAAAAKAKGLPVALPARRTPSSQCKGVSWDKANGKWMAAITVEGRLRHLGRFKEEAEAVAALTKAATALAQGRLTVSTARRQNSSQHKGVHLDKASGKWSATIMLDGKQRRLGLFTDEGEAAAAYTAAALAKAQGREVALPARKQTSSQHKGVTWHKGKGHWRAAIRIDGKKKTLGSFRDELKAAEAYTVAAFWLKQQKAAGASPSEQEEVQCATATVPAAGATVYS